VPPRVTLPDTVAVDTFVVVQPLTANKQAKAAAHWLRDRTDMKPFPSATLLNIRQRPAIVAY
jgi:hypothetical protein